QSIDQRDTSAVGLDARHDARRNARPAILRRRTDPAVRVDHGLRYFHRYLQLDLRCRRAAALDRAQVASAYWSGRKGRRARCRRGAASVASGERRRQPLSVATDPPTVSKCRTAVPTAVLAFL